MEICSLLLYKYIKEYSKFGLNPQIPNYSLFGPLQKMFPNSCTMAMSLWLNLNYLVSLIDCPS